MRGLSASKYVDRRGSGQAPSVAGAISVIVRVRASPQSGHSSRIVCRVAPWPACRNRAGSSIVRATVAG